MYRGVSAAWIASVSQVFLACASSVAPLGRPSPGRDCTPPPPDPHAKLTLERTPCFGECPAFKVEVHPDGMVLYAGIRHVRVEGTREWTIGPAAAAALFARAACGHPETWQASYAWAITDSPGASVTVDPGSLGDAGPLRVWDYPACSDKKLLAAARTFPNMPKPILNRSVPWKKMST